MSIVLIVGMFFTGCASKNNASQLNTNVSNLPIHQMHASFVYDTDNIREAVGICDYVFVAKVVSCDGTEYRNVITTEDEKEILRRSVRLTLIILFRFSKI